jgi:nicotinate phosphoribosyltransferase
MSFKDTNRVVVVRKTTRELRIKELLDQNAPINGFGVGTSMGVSEDVPSLEIAYKLCEYSGTGRLKLSPGKPILPGRKQIFRQIENGRATGDTISSSEEDLPGRALLHQVMDKGARLPRGKRTLEEARETARRETAPLPDNLKDISAKADYPVRISEKLSAKQKRLAKELEE